MYDVEVATKMGNTMKRNLWPGDVIEDTRGKTRDARRIYEVNENVREATKASVARIFGQFLGVALDPPLLLADHRAPKAQDF